MAAYLSFRLLGVLVVTMLAAPAESFVGRLDAKLELFFVYRLA